MYGHWLPLLVVKWVDASTRCPAASGPYDRPGAEVKLDESLVWCPRDRPGWPGWPRERQQHLPGVKWERARCFFNPNKVGPRGPSKAFFKWVL